MEEETSINNREQESADSLEKITPPEVQAIDLTEEQLCALGRVIAEHNDCSDEALKKYMPTHCSPSPSATTNTTCSAGSESDESDYGSADEEPPVIKYVHQTKAVIKFFKAAVKSEDDYKVTAQDVLAFVCTDAHRLRVASQCAWLQERDAAAAALDEQLECQVRLDATQGAIELQNKLHEQLARTIKQLDERARRNDQRSDRMCAAFFPQARKRSRLDAGFGQGVDEDEEEQEIEEEDESEQKNRNRRKEGWRKYEADGAMETLKRRIAAVEERSMRYWRQAQNARCESEMVLRDKRRLERRMFNATPTSSLI